MENLPKCKLSDLEQVLPGDIDLFICSSSFEERCLSIASSISSGRIRNVILATHQDRPECDSGRVLEFRSIYGDKLIRALMSTDNPLVTADGLREALNEAKRDVKNILVDITTFTHESVLILYRLLLVTFKEVNITFSYTSAQEYMLGDDAQQKWLSKGIKNIRSVIGYPGEIRPSQPIHLIILAGYEMDRAARLIENYEPEQLSLGCGKKEESISERLYDDNIKYYRKLLSLLGRASEFEFSTKSPAVTRDVIMAQASLYPDHGVVIAPLNTKISTIGAAMAALERPEFQICYAQAEIYNTEGYSKPGDDCYLFKI